MQSDSDANWQSSPWRIWSCQAGWNGLMHCACMCRDLCNQAWWEYSNQPRKIGHKWTFKNTAQRSKLFTTDSSLVQFMTKKSKLVLTKRAIHGGWILRSNELFLKWRHLLEHYGSPRRKPWQHHPSKILVFVVEFNNLTGKAAQDEEQYSMDALSWDAFLPSHTFLPRYLILAYPH